MERGIWILKTSKTRLLNWKSGLGYWPMLCKYWAMRLGNFGLLIKKMAYRMGDKDVIDHLEMKQFKKKRPLAETTMFAKPMPRFASDIPNIPKTIIEDIPNPLLKNWLTEIYNASKRYVAPKETRYSRSDRRDREDQRDRQDWIY